MKAKVRRAALGTEARAKQRLEFLTQGAGKDGGVSGAGARDCGFFRNVLPVFEEIPSFQELPTAS